MIKKITFLLFILLIILSVNIYPCDKFDTLVEGTYDYECNTPEDANLQMQNDPNQMIYYGDDELKGVKINENGDYSCEGECEISCESTCIINGKEQNDVTDYKQNDDGSFKIGKVKFYKDDTKEILDGKTVSGDDKNLNTGSAQTVKNKDSTAIEVVDYTSTENNFEVKEAKSIVTDNIIFSDVGESSFEYDSTDTLKTANVVSNKNNNTITVKNTDIVINKNDKVVIEKDNDKLILNIDSKNATVTDYGADVKKIRLTNGSKYVYSGNEYHKYSFGATDDVTIQIITDSETIAIDEPNSAVMDLFTNKLKINGKVDYKIMDLFNLTFTNVIQSKSTNNKIQYDMNEQTINFEGEKLSLFSGPFEVKFDDNEVYYKTNLAIHPPYVINKINPNIFINNNGSLHRTMDNNNYFLYADNSESNTNFLRNFENLLP